jgi:protein involved in polysaccharide export with SLBB domain
VVRKVSLVTLLWAAGVRRPWALGMLGLGVPLACSPSPAQSPVELEPPSENTTLGPGDTFRLEIVGETDLPKEYQVSADGTVNVPFIHSVVVAGLEPHEVAALVRAKLIEGQILTDPSVVVSVTEYRSKRIAILGQVQEPGSFPLSPGMTLIQALSLGGGLTSIAQANHVTLSRTTGGKVKTVTLDVTAISEGRAPDIPLQPGDRIYVPERVF